MSKMNPEVKAKWLTALRGGEYKQVASKLRGRGAHCCLGVLCDLFAKERGRPKWTLRELSELSEGSNPFHVDGAMPGAVVVMWAGLNAEAKVRIGSVVQTLADHNDTGRTFAEIADAIEAQL